MKNQPTAGSRALVIGQHPHTGKQVTLLSYGPYGLSVLNLVGWLVRDDEGQEFYCQDKDLEFGLPSLAVDAAGELVEEVEAEELLPTVSPGKRETTLDRLQAFYAVKDGEPVLLTRHQQVVLRRLEACWATLLEFKVTEKAVTMLMKQFKVSRAQAYRDVRDCNQLFGGVVKSNREAERYIMREMAITIFTKAKKAGELGEMNKALANLIKITGIEHDDPNVPTDEQLAPSTYVLELMPAGGQPMRLNLEAIAALPAHEYEEILDVIQQSGLSDLEMLQKIQEAARGTVR